MLFYQEAYEKVEILSYLCRHLLMVLIKNNSVEVISVADYKVNPCIGCNTCFDREGHECFQKDDMTKVYEKLKMADVLVIASPVYFYGVSAQLKVLIDRLHTPMDSIKKGKSNVYCVI